MDINWQELYKEYREENTKTFPLYEGFSKSPKEVFDWFKNKLSEKPVDMKYKSSGINCSTCNSDKTKEVAGYNVCERCGNYQML